MRTRLTSADGFHRRSQDAAFHRGTNSRRQNQRPGLSSTDEPVYRSCTSTRISAFMELRPTDVSWRWFSWKVMLFSKVCSNANLDNYTGYSCWWRGVSEGQYMCWVSRAMGWWTGSSECSTFVDGQQPAVLKPVADSFLKTEGLQSQHLASNPENSTLIIFHEQYHVVDIGPTISNNIIIIKKQTSKRINVQLTVKCSSSCILKVLKAVVMPPVRSDFGSTSDTKTGSVLPSSHSSICAASSARDRGLALLWAGSASVVPDRYPSWTQSQFNREWFHLMRLKINNKICSHH